MILKALDVYYVMALSKRDSKPFLKIEIILLGFAGCCFFQKLPPEGRTTPWNLCFSQKMPPEGRIHHETYLLFSNAYTKMSKSKLFTLLTPWNLSFISKKKHQNVKIEIVYTSDTMKFKYFSKILPEGQPKPWNLHSFFKNSRRRLN